jgi:hypothetical protein
VGGGGSIGSSIDETNEAVLTSGKQSILFTDDAAVIEKESPFVFNPTGDEDGHCMFINDGEAVDR